MCWCLSIIDIKHYFVEVLLI